MWGLLIFGVLSLMKILRVSEDMEVKGMLPVIILQLYFMLLMCTYQNTDHLVAPKRDSPKCDTYTSLDTGEIESGSKKM